MLNLRLLKEEQARWIMKFCQIEGFNRKHVSRVLRTDALAHWASNIALSAIQSSQQLMDASNLRYRSQLE